MSKQEIICADCVVWMKQQAPNSFDAIVTDPPYGLEFMGSAWDTFAVRLPRDVFNARRFAHLTAVERLRREDVTDKAQLVLLVYQEWTRQWALEAHRILKPGAYMLVMGGVRTHHRLMAGLEDAGFIIRDCLCWIYATGFPKSYDISKGFDKKAGVKQEVVGEKVSPDGIPYSQRQKSWGVLGQDRSMNYTKTAPSTDLAKQWQGWGTALKPAYEPIVLCQKPLEGTYCENVEKWGVGGLNIDATRVATEEETRRAKSGWQSDGYVGGRYDPLKYSAFNSRPQQGRFPANVQIDSEPDNILDDGTVHKSDIARIGSGGKGRSEFSRIRSGDKVVSCYADSGSFTRFFVIPKASKSERDRGLEGVPQQPVQALHGNVDGTLNKRIQGRSSMATNYHPTVKPIRLFKQMLKLVTPPNGIVLDPFVGSGTACLAAKELDINCIGIDNNEDYCEIARQRLV